MKIAPDLEARLAFLVRVTKREIGHLRYSADNVFQTPFSLERAQSLESNPVLAEQVEAYTSRFCRLQDMVGDKLLPAWLKALGEKTGAAIDNLDKAEKLGVLTSADEWVAMRQLRNQMIHEYIEDMSVLADALQMSFSRLDMIIGVGLAICADLETRGFTSG